MDTADNGGRVLGATCGRLHLGTPCSRMRGHIGSHIGSTGTEAHAEWMTCDVEHPHVPGAVCNRAPGHPGPHDTLDGNGPGSVMVRWTAGDDDPYNLEDDDMDLTDDVNLDGPQLLEPDEDPHMRLARAKVAILTAVLVLLIVCMPAAVWAAYRFAF